MAIVCLRTTETTVAYGDKSIGTNHILPTSRFNLAGKSRIVENGLGKVLDEHSFLRVLCASVFHFSGGDRFHEERLVDGVNRIVNGYGSQALKS